MQKHKTNSATTTTTTATPPPSLLIPQEHQDDNNDTEEEKIKTAFAFLDATLGTGRLTLFHLQKRLGPLLFHGRNKTKKEKQNAFFRLLLGSTVEEEEEEEKEEEGKEGEGGEKGKGEEEAGLTLAELKALLLTEHPDTSPSAAAASSSSAAFAFKTLDTEGKGYLDPTLLVRILQGVEGVTAGEQDMATLVRAVDRDGNGKIGLWDFCGVLGALKGGQGEREEGKEGRCLGRRTSAGSTIMPMSTID